MSGRERWRPISEWRRIVFGFGSWRSRLDKHQHKTGWSANKKLLRPVGKTGVGFSAETADCRVQMDRSGNQDLRWKRLFPSSRNGWDLDRRRFRLSSGLFKDKVRKNWSMGARNTATNMCLELVNIWFSHFCCLVL